MRFFNNAGPVCFRDSPTSDRSVTVTAEDVEEAREVLIQRRDTHLDQLADKLREPRVRRVIAPLLAGEDEPGHLPVDYKEAGPQLLLQAFLQRIVNGGGRIEREYGPVALASTPKVGLPPVSPRGGAPQLIAAARLLRLRSCSLR